MSYVFRRFFFFNDTATTEIYTLSLHDALPIWRRRHRGRDAHRARRRVRRSRAAAAVPGAGRDHERDRRSEEHTSELQSRQYLVCRLLLEKKQQRISAEQTSKVLILQSILSTLL